jgi:hypothetical protein
MAALQPAAIPGIVQGAPGPQGAHGNVPGPQGGAQQGPAQVDPGARGIAFNAPIRHCTFASFFSDASTDPNHAGAFQAVARYNPSVAVPLTAAALKQSLINQPNPNTFLCCATINGNAPRVYLVHSLSRFPASLTGHVTPWDDRIIGFLGDVLGDTALNVILPDTLFDETPNTLVYNEDTLIQELPGLDDTALFPRVHANANNANNATNLQSRLITYLPTRYASLVLDNKGYTPKQLWTLLAQRLQDDNVLNQMGPLVTWLRLTLHATGQNDTGPPVTSIDLVSPFVDQDLISHRSPYRQVLGGLQQPSPGLETAITQFATAVNSQVAEAQTAHLVRELERDQPTLPSVKFNMLFRSLLNYLNVDQEQDLPDFWFGFAAAKKKQEFGTVRDALETYARGATAFGPFAPIPTPKLLSDLGSITFVGDHPDDLKTGINPFNAMDGSEEFRAAAHELARSYIMLAEQGMAITFSDLDHFKLPKDIRCHPTNFYEMEQSLAIFGNMLGTILGDTHVLTTSYRTFWTAFKEEFKARIHYEIDSRRVIKPVHILRNIQLIVFNWFTSKKLRREPSTPNFQDILERFSLQVYTIPTLPMALYQLINPRPRFPPPGPSVTTGTTTPPTAISDDASMQSAVSALTGNTTVTHITSQSRYGTPVPNPVPDATLQALLPSTVRIKDLLGSDDAPKNEAGSPICLSFHLKGLCFSRCR